MLGQTPCMGTCAHRCVMPLSSNGIYTVKMEQEVKPNLLTQVLNPSPSLLADGICAKVKKI